ncbi:hypothetical protein FJZ53_00390 [Candidatus Woesearchaeota archaeon]|nr:hypothetical protein [Candidatus Woesearchaeota archaeon]
MAEIEFIIPPNKPLKVTVESVFSMHDLYRHIRKWLDEHKYVTFEKDYREVAKESGKSAAIKLAPWRKVDDYTKFCIDIKIKFKDLKEVETRSGILNQGEVSVKFESFLEKDYENRWENNFMTRFIRSLNDHFFISDKLEGYKAELRDDTYDLFNEIKSFLGLHRIQKP